MFRDGQRFLSGVGLGRVVTAYLLGAAANSSSSSEGTIGGAPSYAPGAGITAGSLYRGSGRTLGSVASNRTQQSGAARQGPAPSISRHPDGGLERGERDVESGGRCCCQRRGGGARGTVLSRRIRSCNG